MSETSDHHSRATGSFTAMTVGIIYQIPHSASGFKFRGSSARWRLNSFKDLLALRDGVAQRSGFATRPRSPCFQRFRGFEMVLHALLI